MVLPMVFFFFSSRRRHTRLQGDWSSDVCSSDLTPIAGPPVAFEPPSAGFALDWRSIAAMRVRGVAFDTITHAAGLSSTGDAELDRRLPFDEPYRIPDATAWAIRRTQASGGRIIAIGTTVVRALEHSASRDGFVHGGEGLATQRIDAASRLRVVDALLTGIHEPRASPYQLLRAFADENTLRRASVELDAHGYRTHEFGDSVFIERKVLRAAACTERIGLDLLVAGQTDAAHEVVEARVGA